jgi:hypothetical protein
MSTNREVLTLLGNMEARDLCRQVVGDPPKADPVTVQTVESFIPKRTEAIRRVIIHKDPDAQYNEVIREDEVRAVSECLDMLGY